MPQFIQLPRQQLSFSKKTKEWRKKHLDWAENRTFFNYSPVRRSVLHKRINYDLLNGRLHMQDMELVLNPENIRAGYIPDKIQHYPIMNSKINVLRGEESKRVFDYRVIVTNPLAISEIENNKKQELFQRLQEIVQNTAQSEDEFNAELEKLNDYFAYEWQDIKEIRANALLNHYVKEYNIPYIFNTGFIDAMVAGEEIYQCDIVGGEPVIEKLNPMKVRVFKSGYSNKIEDADVVLLEDYWSPGRIIDTYYDVLTPADIKYLEELPNQGETTDGMDNYDERDNFVFADFVDPQFIDVENMFLPFGTFGGTKMYYDSAGNVRVLRMYWKSRRKIKKVKSYDPQTGETVYNFYPETYRTRVELGEEEEIFWINEAWEGTKIGKEIYVNIRPKPIQYNRLSNPSRCHFGIIGSIYNIGDQRAYSLVDMMKPYNYLYDAIHDRLNKAIAANWGKIMELDLASVPEGWNVEKWMYYAKVNHIAVKNSFKEGTIGAATGKIAGAFAANSRGVIDAETGNYIQQHINLLEFIKMEMAEVAGISKQREGQISNRETVGGVERATLQSSHITEWLFTTHEDVKRRVLECFLETAKVALKGGSKKFQYILSDMSSQIMEIDGDEFAEADYGLVVDNSNASQELNSKMDALAQAALQNQLLSFSTIMDLYSSSSIAEKKRFVQKDEQAIQERQAQAQQAEMEAQQQAVQANMQMKQAELDQRARANELDNETKLLIAQMQAYAGEETTEDVEYSPEAKAKLEEQIREFDERLKLDKERLEFDRSKAQLDARLKEKQINKPNKTTK